MADKLTKRDLADGAMLRELIKMFQTSNTQISLAGLLTCLKDSSVIVPVKIKDGEKIENNKELSFSPCIVKTDDGSKYMATFSNVEQVDDNIRENYKLIEIEFKQCMSMADRIKGINGIIIDAYTRQFVLKKEVFGYVRGIPSKISK